MTDTEIYACIAAIIADVDSKRACWWTPEAYRRVLNSRKPPEAVHEYGASIAWDDAVRAAVKVFVLAQLPVAETMELDLNGGNHD